MQVFEIFVKTLQHHSITIQWMQTNTGNLMMPLSVQYFIYYRVWKYP